jgi:hypothetical protein
VIIGTLITSSSMPRISTLKKQTESHQLRHYLSKFCCILTSSWSFAFVDGLTAWAACFSRPLYLTLRAEAEQEIGMAHEDTLGGWGDRGKAAYFLEKADIIVPKRRRPSATVSMMVGDRNANLVRRAT